jgi:DNA polymerase III subunit beta
MKIICTQENLKSGLLVAGRIISTNNTLPILNNILLKTENGTLKISSTNLEVAITTQVRCMVEEEGETTVFSKTITDLINNLPNQNIILQTTENKLKIETENYHTEIKTLPAEEFPLIPEVEKNETFIIDSQEFKKSIDQTVFAASTNQTQPEITGVLFSSEGKILKMAATDRYRLAEKNISLDKELGSVKESIVPQKTINELSRIIGTQKGKVEVVCGETQISLNFLNTQIISRLIDGQYPDYKQIIPATFNTTIITEKTKLGNALKTTGIFSQQSNSVKMKYSTKDQNLILTSESAELGKSEVVLPSKIEGLEGEIMLNNRYILDALNGIDSEKAVIKIVDDNSPSVIRPEKGDNYMNLVMPIKS